MKFRKSEADYDKNMLPKTRKELLRDILKLHLPKILMYGVISFAFMIPLIVSKTISEIYSMELMKSITESMSDDEIKKIIESIMTFETIRGIINIPLFMILFLGLSGIFRLIRQHAFNENVDFSHEFIKGIKQNKKEFLIIGLIFGIISFILKYIMNMSSMINKGGIYDWLGIIPTVVLAMFLFPIMVNSLVSSTLYENKLKDNLRIGRIVYFSSLLKTLLISLIILIPVMFTFVSSLIFKMVGLMLFGILIPLYLVFIYLNAYDILDEKVNKNLHPELVDKGLYKEKENK